MGWTSGGGFAGYFSCLGQVASSVTFFMSPAATSAEKLGIMACVGLEMLWVGRGKTSVCITICPIFHYKWRSCRSEGAKLDLREVTVALPLAARCCHCCSAAAEFASGAWHKVAFSFGTHFWNSGFLRHRGEGALFGASGRDLRPSFLNPMARHALCVSFCHNQLQSHNGKLVKPAS